MEAKSAAFEQYLCPRCRKPIHFWITPGNAAHPLGFRFHFFEMSHDEAKANLPSQRYEGRCLCDVPSDVLHAMSLVMSYEREAPQGADEEELELDRTITQIHIDRWKAYIAENFA